VELQGESLAALGRHTDALSCFDRALQLKEDYDDAWNNKGAAFIALGKFDEALLSRARHCPCAGKPGGHFNKGVALKNLSARGGKRLFRQSHHAGQSVRACATRGRANTLVEQGRLEASIACFDAAIKLNEKFEQAWLGQGKALQAWPARRKPWSASTKSSMLNDASEGGTSPRGSLLSALGRQKQAGASFDR